MFEGVNLLLMSHWVFGKYAAGVSHASVLIEPEPFHTSAGTLLAYRGQNQILMKVVVRSIAYLNQEGKSPSRCQALHPEWGFCGSSTHHPPPLLLNAGP
jgi:hypothetical protein